MRPPRDNPFRVDRVTTLPYVGLDAAALADRFLRLGRAAIVGPHGVGKSTLMRSIGEMLCDRGLEVVSIVLPGSAARDERVAMLRAIEQSAADSAVLLDGYEQLSWIEARHVRRCPRLLVTAHRRTLLRPLVTLRPSLDMWQAVLRELGVAMSPREIAAFRRHHGDVREALMTLFDAWAAEGEGSSTLPPPNLAQMTR